MYATRFEMMSKIARACRKGCESMQRWVQFVCQVGRKAAQIERNSVRIELVKMRVYAERVASVCNCGFCEDRHDGTACVRRKTCVCMQLGSDQS